MSTLSSAPPPFRPRPAPHGPWATLRRGVRRHRRALAALCAAAAVLCTVAALTPDPPPSAPVVVAAHALPGGRPLTAGDLRLAGYPPDLVPAEALTDPEPLLGRVLTAPVTAGTPLTPPAVLAPRAAPARAGMAMAPIRLGDPGVAALLRVGDVVDVTAAPGDGGPARVVVTGARVLGLPAAAAQAGPFGGDDARGPLVVVEVPTAAALELAEVQGSAQLSILVR